jgi:hypothetical protein
MKEKKIITPLKYKQNLDKPLKYVFLVQFAL